MSKTIKDKFLELIQDVPVSHDKFGVPYIKMFHYNTMVEMAKDSDFGGFPAEKHFYIEPKEKVVAYSYEIAVDTKLYSKKLFEKYQKKVDKFIKKEYKKLYKRIKENGRKL